MKNPFLLLAFILCPLWLFSQSLDVEGQAKISVMNSDPTAQYFVVRQPDGTLAVRDASTLSDGDGDSTNEIQDLSLVGNILTITNNGSATSIDLSAYLDNTDTQLNETEVDAFTSNNGYLTTEVDGSVINEIQDLSLSNNILTITNNSAGTDIDLSTYLDNMDTQLTETEVDAFVNNNGYITAELDGSTTNEIQALSISNDTIYLENGGFVKLPENADDDPNNELQSFTVSTYGDTLFLSDGNHIIIPNISVTNRPTLDFLMGGNNNEESNSIVQTADGGFIVAGYSGSSLNGDVTDISNGSNDYWLVKLDANYAIEWDNLIGGSSTDVAYSIVQTTDGGYVVAGLSYSTVSGDIADTSNGNADYWVVKLDSSGAIEWNNLIGGNAYDQANSIAQTSDGGYIVAGYSQSSVSGDVTDTSNGVKDYWVVKLDSNGAIEWSNLIGGSSNDQANSIAQTSDSGYIVAGYSQSSASGDVTNTNNGSFDYWIVKLDLNGVIEWDKLIGGSSTDLANSIEQTSDGGYIVAGYSSSSTSGDVTDTTNGSNDYWIVKLDSNGAIEWNNLIGGSSTDLASSIIQTTDGGYVVAGRSSSTLSGDVSGTNNGNDDYWIVKLDSSGAIEWNNLIGGSDQDVAKSIIQTIDGGYMVAGYSSSTLSGDVTDTNNSPFSVYDYWIVKLDVNGDIEVE